MVGETLDGQEEVLDATKVDYISGGVVGKELEDDPIDDELLTTVFDNDAFTDKPGDDVADDDSDLYFTPITHTSTTTTTTTTSTYTGVDKKRKREVEAKSKRKRGDVSPYSLSDDDVSVMDIKPSKKSSKGGARGRPKKRAKDSGFDDVDDDVIISNGISDVIIEDDVDTGGAPKRKRLKKGSERVDKDDEAKQQKKPKRKSAKKVVADFFQTRHQKGLNFPKSSSSFNGVEQIEDSDEG